MNRLQAELRRLYGIAADEPPAPEPASPAPPSGGEAGTRALVLELPAPPGWSALRPLWEALQSELELPAPAIAVSGLGTYQLWFSLAEPLPQGEAAGFLQGLRARYLGGMPAQRVGLHTSVGGSAMAGAGTFGACVAPPVQSVPDRWSAFLSPDLAAVFADEPWLDIPPGVDAQADVLARLQTTRTADLRRAAERLAATAAAAMPASPAATPAAPLSAIGGAGPRNETAAASLVPTDPGRFLLAVMNDPSVELALRIEAAKALLAGSAGTGPR